MGYKPQELDVHLPGGDMIKISAVYQIINNITGDRYVGSSNNVKRRWARHKCPSSLE